MAATTWDITLQSATLGGVAIPLDADDVVATISLPETAGSVATTSGGTIMYRIPNNTATLTIAAYESSSAYTTLMGIYAARRIPGAMQVPLPGSLTVAPQVNSPGYTASWSTCAITQGADFVLGVTPPVQTWTLTLADISITGIPALPLP